MDSIQSVSLVISYFGGPMRVFNFIQLSASGLYFGGAACVLNCFGTIAALPATALAVLGVLQARDVVTSKFNSNK